MISNLQKKRILDYLVEGKRFDGRGLLDMRDSEVKIGISQNAEGSCSLKVGKTEVFVGVKMAISQPYPDNPDEGSLSTTLELAPMADEDFEMGPPKIEAIEMARVVDRGIRESGFIDFKKLCIKEGEKCWQISLDIYAINNDGNLFDVASLASLIALANAKLPVYNSENGRIEHSLSSESLPLNKEAMSFNLTFYKVGDSFLIDPTKEEEEIASYRLAMAVADNQGEARITAMQKGREGAITIEDMENIITLVEAQYKILFPKIKEIVWKKH
jgi:exosome complex component RRP42